MDFKLKLNTRITYVKKQDHLFVSKKMFLTSEDIVEVMVDNADLTFRIVTNQGQVIKKGKANTLAKTKKAAKEMLKSLGAQFMCETRNKLNVLKGDKK
jgi:chromosome condensin MukBEF complex kleisin-like MukF subunit